MNFQLNAVPDSAQLGSALSCRDSAPFNNTVVNGDRQLTVGPFFLILFHP